MNPNLPARPGRSFSPAVRVSWLIPLLAWLDLSGWLLVRQAREGR